MRAACLAEVVARRLRPHVPVYDRHVCKPFFVCEPVGDLDIAFTSAGTSEVTWFDVDALPELSMARVLPEQIALLYKHRVCPGPAFAPRPPGGTRHHGCDLSEELVRPTLSTLFTPHTSLLRLETGKVRVFL